MLDYTANANLQPNLPRVGPGYTGPFYVDENWDTVTQVWNFLSLCQQETRSVADKLREAFVQMQWRC